MRWILLGAAAAGLVLAGATGTLAQGMGSLGMKGDDAKPRAFWLAKAAPRAKRYGYRSRAAGPAPGSCGQFKYWSKGSCKDARTSPPSLK